MSWIADVIYSLKQLEGKPFFVKRDGSTFDPTTGTKTMASLSSFFIPLIIPLPLNTRQAFFKAINMAREAYLQPGESQFAVDMSDIPNNQTILIGDYILDANNKRYDISGTDNSQGEILLVTTKTPQ